MIDRGVAPIALLVLLAGCSPKPADKSANANAAPAQVLPAHVSTTEGFSTPESVLWDAEQGVWFVSNINGGGTAKDNNGFISRLTSEGAVDSMHFVQGGRGGVVLNGPKGLARVGDTLWVADIDAVRGFDRHTGAPVASIELGHQAKFLNDAVAGPDGTLYITDTGAEFDAKGQMSHPGPDRIFAVKGRNFSVAAEGAWLEGPNGIAWDGANNRFLLAPFAGPDILGWTPGSAKVDTLGKGPGGQDGAEFLPDGRALITSWADSSVFTFKDGVSAKVITGVSSPADIGLDPARGWIALPRFMDNKVEFWAMK